MVLSKSRKKQLYAVLLALFSAALFSQLPKTPFLGRFIHDFENVVYDWCFSLKFILEERDSATKQKNVTRDNTLESRIVLVDIDEISLEKLGSYWDWPRNHHADVVRNLAQGGAASTTFDILFKKADYGSFESARTISILNKQYPKQNWSSFSQGIRTGFDDDKDLENAVASSQNVIAGMTLGPHEEYEHESQWRPLSTPERQKLYSPQSSLIADSTANHFLQHDILDNIFLGLAQNAQRVGLVNVVADDDGVHRREPLLHKFPNPEIHKNTKPHLYASIGLQTSLYLMGKSIQSIKIKPAEHINLGKLFRVFRKNGKLQTSYPGLSWAMLANAIKQKEIFLQLPKSKKNKVLEAASQVILYYEDDKLLCDIFDAQTLTSKMLKLIQETPDIIPLPKEAFSEKKLKYGLSLQWDEEEEKAMFVDEEEDEEVYIDDYTLSILQKNNLNIKSKERKHLAMNLQISYDDFTQKYSSNILALQDDILKEIFKTPLSSFSNLKEGSTLSFGPDIKVPIDQQGRMYINYSGNVNVLSKTRTFKTYSYVDVMRNRVDPAAYQGAAFILGSTAAALMDIVSVPAQRDFPGVYIHMNMIENIMNNSFLHMAPKNKMFVLCALISILGIFIALYLRPILTFFLFSCFGFGWFLYHYNAFTEGVYHGIVMPELSLILAFFTAGIFRYLFEEKDRKQAIAAFKSYISPELIDEMLESDKKPSLGGEEKELTAYFTDIASFSTFSEKIGSPSKLVELLNEYLTAMTDILVEENGTLDKYEGDAIIAFFGAPVPLESHAYSACYTALKMQNTLDVLREKWASEGDKWPRIVHQMRMRIGINSGQIVTGNMGSAMRMNYTMMGDAVNLAARLESGAKQYGVFTMCSKETLLLAGDHFLSRPIDKVRVIGKSEPVETIELLSLKESPQENHVDLIRLWDKAKEAYTTCQWQTAITLFEECLAFEPHHPDRASGCKTTPSHVFIERCKSYQEHPPVEKGEIWDGVYTATEK